MKGFEINICGKSLNAAVGRGSCGIAVSYDTRTDKCIISVSGADRSGSVLKWYEGIMNEGDELEAKFVEVESVSEHMEEAEPEQEEDTVEKAKEIYRSLRPVLLEAGLID